MSFFVSLAMFVSMLVSVISVCVCVQVLERSRHIRYSSQIWFNTRDAESVCCKSRDDAHHLFASQINVSKHTQTQSHTSSQVNKRERWIKKKNSRPENLHLYLQSTAPGKCSAV